jgi:hypothetical protein
MANARYTLGCALSQAGRTTEGLHQLMAARQIFHDSRQVRWEGVTHYRIAEAHLLSGNPAQAAAHAEQAIALRVIGGEWRKATVLVVLGKALAELGQSGRARACLKDASAIFDGLGSPEGEEVHGLLALAQAE